MHSSGNLPAFRHRYATRLNSFRSGTDSGRGIAEIIGSLASIPGLSALELNFPQHFNLLTDDALQLALDQTGLALTTLNLRYEGEEYQNGAFTAPDLATRDRAIAVAIAAVDKAAMFGADHVIIWLADDGWDYPFQVDHSQLWSLALAGFRRVAEHDPSVRVSIEYKPWGPRRFSVIRTMSDALLATRNIDLPNLGVTLDVCHSQMTGEAPPAAASLALGENRLFGVHLNDGYGRDDDGFAFGSINPLAAAELLLTLREGQYNGTFYFDTFPIREDPAAECRTNIETVEALEAALDRVDRPLLLAARDRHDALAARCVIEEALLGSNQDTLGNE